MQAVNATFTSEERDDVRSIAHSLLVSWKKDFRAGITFFTIGTSTIGGPDIIPYPTGALSAWNKYLYEDESNYVTRLGYERELNMPIGGVTKALADAELDNVSGRFLPRYMGGTSSLFTAIEPRKPFIVNTGFTYNGIDHAIPQFVGITTKQPRVDVRNKRVELQGADFVDFLQNRYLDQDTMFTTQRVDQVIQNTLTTLGYGTSQYELDQGISVVNFGLFPKGTRLADMFDQLVKSEYGHFYQDEEGILRFENRQHWSNSPHNAIQRVITTAQVIYAEAPNDDHIINVVEIKSKARKKQPQQTVYELAVPIEVPASGIKEVFLEFENPILELTDPTDSGTVSFFDANDQSDGTGNDMGSSILFTRQGLFSTAVKYKISNSAAKVAYITSLTLGGRPAKITSEIYVRKRDDSSVTAFEERPLLIDNDFIQDQTWAESLAQQILNDFAEPENLQTITIRAIPELQLGDLISWQGRYFLVFGIKTQIEPEIGFIQELKLLQRQIQTYFRIGISTIGSSTDSIAP